MSANSALNALLESRLQGSDPAFALQGDVAPRQFVPYMDLGAGLNTRKDPHALARNELASLTNAWYAQGQSLGKRPGLTAWVTSIGTTGKHVTHIKSLVAARFGGFSWLVIQDQANNIWYAPSVPPNTGTKWQQIGSISGGIMRGAQMYDPELQQDTLFIVSGYDIPQYWVGPNTKMQPVDTTVNHLPTKANSITQPITPAYVATLGNNSHLFYAGEPTAPSAVYVSDPFYPESFTTPLTQVNPMQGAYQPALIGNNDGVDGGAITGMQTLGSAMLIFKESAVYTMVETQLLGDIAFMVENISSTVGCLSPRSIVAMDGFVCFLGIDGVYMTDGNTAQQLSGNVPTFFDSTVLGSPAEIANRNTAISFRHGTRYIIFFDTGTNFADTGVWFDFAVQADQGLPACGVIQFSPGAATTGMYCGGAATLRGPHDDGNVAIAAANFNFVGKFGLGFSDVAAQYGPQAPQSVPITVTMRGKADFFEDAFGNDAMMCLKNVDKIRLLVSIYQTSTPIPFTFTGNVITDVFNAFPITSTVTTLPQLPGPRWGTPAEGGTGDIWGGPAVWTAAPLGSGLFFDIPMLSPSTAIGKIVQMEFSESSQYGWLILGYALQIGKQQVND